METETLVEVDEANDSESNTVEVSNLATEKQSKKVADQPSKDVDEKSSEAVVKPAAKNDWIVTLAMHPFVVATTIFQVVVATMYRRMEANVVTTDARRILTIFRLSLSRSILYLTFV